MGQGSKVSQPLTRLSKMEMPLFFSENILSWIFQIEHFFSENILSGQSEERHCSISHDRERDAVVSFVVFHELTHILGSFCSLV